MMNYFMHESYLSFYYKHCSYRNLHLSKLYVHTIILVLSWVTIIIYHSLDSTRH